MLLEKILPEHGVMENYEVEHDFPGIGRRMMCLNARQVFYEVGSHTNILLGIEDITERPYDACDDADAFSSLSFRIRAYRL